jgi:DNA polymerase I-like protein with 3'-5' exonuclease and polymerase domains
MLQSGGVDRSAIYITNIVKCRPPNNRTPRPDEVDICSRKWLHQEVNDLAPKYILAVGRVSVNLIRSWCGLPPETMDHVHGKPFLYDRSVVIPCYHPAAGLHNPKLMRYVEEDFESACMVINGLPWQQLHVVDEYTNPQYSLTYQPIFTEDSEDIAVDTEQAEDGKPWSWQYSMSPGAGHLIKANKVIQLSAQVAKHNRLIVHNWLYDSKYVNVSPGQVIIDTMVCAYLLGLPQSLKTLAARLCGMEMKSYMEYTGSYRYEKALEYLWKVSELTGLPKASPRTEDEWDAVKGGLRQVTHKPLHIVSKARTRIIKAAKDEGYDPYTDWYKIPSDERYSAEAILGAMPDAYLRDLPTGDATYYAVRDADATLRVWHVLESLLAEKDLSFVAYQMDIPLLTVVSKMMARGMVVSTPELQVIGAKMGAHMQGLAAEIMEIAGHAVNPNSGPQVAQLIYNELRDSKGIRFPVTHHTKTKLPATDDRELKKVDHPVVPLVLEYRGAQKIKGTYADPLVVWAAGDPENAIHTTLKTTRTGTGRLSSADPNLQNIPAHSAAGNEIRSAFHARPGYVFVEMDYSQIEMRVFAHIASAAKLIQMFREGKDIHSENASKFFSIPVESFKDKSNKELQLKRYSSKRGGFGVVYWISPEGLTQTLMEEGVKDWTLDLSKNFIKWFTRDLVPELTPYRQETMAFGRRNGYVQDMFGRIMYAPALRSNVDAVRNAAEREATNMPVQAGAQGIIKLAMVELESQGVEDRGAFWVMQIHDSKR